MALCIELHELYHTIYKPTEALASCLCIGERLIPFDETIAIGLNIYRDSNKFRLEERGERQGE
jgi:hypothetical protein